MSKEIEEYILKRGIKGPWKIELSKLPAFIKQVIVIPAYDELENLPKLLNSLNKNDQEACKNTLLIIVVNNKEKGYTEEKIISNNQETLNYLREIQKNKIYPFQIGIIDASSPGYEIPKEEGVGLIRKIGMDMGVKILLESGNPYGGLVCLDADCEVSENYIREWETFFKEHPGKAGIMAFAHPIENTEIGTAITFYEIFIRLYELCLWYANSPYSFIPIGSTIGVDSKLYTSVGGMSTKNAGEDFYFLQKIAKVGEIRKISTASVYPSSRISDRVIFGTGAKVKEYITSPERMNRFYNLKSFEILKDWIKILDNPLETPELMLDKAKIISAELANFILLNKWNEKAESIYKQTKNKFYISWRLHEWFDGLKTLRLIHWLREKLYPDVNLLEVSKYLISQLQGNRIKEDATPVDILNCLRKTWNYNIRDGVGIIPHLIKHHH